MGGLWSHDHTVRSGVVRLSDLAYLLLGNNDADEEEVPHTIVAVWDQGVWCESQLHWSAISACVCKQPKEQMIAVSEWGEYFVSGQGEVREGNIFNSVDPGNKKGALRSVASVDGYAYAVGMQRQLYRRDGNDKWSRADNNMPRGSKKQSCGLESLDGFSESEMYAVGWSGEIWRYDGKRWSELNSPTNVILNSVFCAPDGNVYCCGRNGILIRGRNTQWELIEHGDTTADLWDVCWFEDRLFVSSISFLYELNGERLISKDFGEPISCYHLSAADGILWSIGSNDVMEYDGKAWRRIDY